MELFKNTHYDFLGNKWPFIGASLVLSAAGIISLIVNHGPRWGIDLVSGAEVRLRFNVEPPVAKIRAALDTKMHGESVQQVTGKQEVMIVAEVANDQELNATVETIEGTVRTMFGDPAGVDLNNASPDELTNRLNQAGELALHDVIRRYLHPIGNRQLSVESLHPSTNCLRSRV